MQTATQETFQETEETKKESKTRLSKVSKGIVLVGAAATVLTIGFAVYANFIMATSVSAAMILIFVDTMSISFLGALGTACITASYEALIEIF